MSIMSKKVMNKNKQDVNKIKNYFASILKKPRASPGRHTDTLNDPSALDDAVVEHGWRDGIVTRIRRTPLSPTYVTIMAII